MRLPATLERHLKTACAAVAIAVAAALVPPAAASAAPTPAAPAAAFVNSIGVNVHLNYTDTVYGQFEKVRSALHELGIHYIRDAVGYSNKTQFAKLRILYGDGIRVNAMAGDPLQRYGVGPLPVQLNAYEQELGPALASLEGPNEYDIQGDPNWVADLRAFQQQLWEEVQRRPILSSVPVLGPSLVQRQSRAALGDISAWTTEGNMHPYPGGEQPDADLHMNSELSLAAVNTGTKPVQATETGYTNAVNEVTGQLPTSERAAGVYEPRIFLDNFRRGITRTYVYELLDEHEDSSRSDQEDNFGLLHNNFSPKPAFTSLKNLIGLVSDSGPAFTPGSLSYSLAGAPTGTRTLLLEKSDGSYYLAVWSPVSVWNQTTRAELHPPTGTVTLNLEQPVTGVQVFRPDESTSPVATGGAVASVAIPVGPEVTLVRVTLPAPKTAAAPAPAARRIRLALKSDSVSTGGLLRIHGRLPAGRAGKRVSIQAWNKGWQTLDRIASGRGGRFRHSVRIAHRFAPRSRLRVVSPHFAPSRPVRFDVRGRRSGHRGTALGPRRAVAP